MATNTPITVIPIDGKCSTNRRNMGFQFVKEDNKLVAQGSFVDYGGNERKPMDVSGEFYTAPKFKCTCGNQYLYQCRSCGKFICYNGLAQSDAVCPNCGKKGSVPKAIESRRIMCSGSGAVGDIDIILAIDVSGSMRGDRISSVKKAAVEQFVRKYSKGCRMALISFESTVVVKSPLTPDLKKIEGLINGLSASGGTRSPLDTVLESQHFKDFLNASNNRYLVILTDGAWDGDEGCHIARANEIKAKGVKILTIGCPGANGYFLNRIASQDGVIVTSDSDIGKAFADIAKRTAQ